MAVLRYLMTRTWMSMLGLIVAVPVATLDYFALGDSAGCSYVTVLQGANIHVACRIVAFSGFATATLALIAFLVANERGRGLGTLLFLEAGALTVAVGLVLADSATYIARFDTFSSCGNRAEGLSTVVSHVYGLLGVSVVALAFVALRAFGALTGVERPEPTERRRKSNYSMPAS